MASTADAVIIGGGIMGASTAHYLAKKGYGKIVLLEKNRLASGATGYSAANVRQHYSNEVTIQLAVRAVEMFSNAETEFGGEVGFTPCGYMVIVPPEQEQAIRHVVPLQRELGVDAQFLDPKEISSRFPALKIDDISLGCFEFDSGYADPVMTVRTLVETSRSLGVDLREQCTVLDIRTSDGKVTGVVTGDGEIQTDCVVNAAGPWADRIGRMAGIGYVLRFSREHEVVFTLPHDIGPLPVVADAVHRIFFRPQGTDKILVGESYPKALEPCDPETYDDSADDKVIRRMVSRLVERVPALKQHIDVDNVRRNVVVAYSGVYSITDDWYPIVGGHPDCEGYFCAIGGSGHGFKIGPPIGESLADLIAGDSPRVDISPLGFDRFERGAQFRSAWGSGNRG